METTTYKKCTIKLVQDEDAESPREWDNVGEILYTSSRYTLGDRQTTAEEIVRTVTDEDSRYLGKYSDQYLPGVLGNIARAEICMYTNTPDLHFIFDAHPRHDNVLVVSAWSGHGFKFSSAIGEAAAQWAHDGASALDLRTDWM